MAKDGLKVPKCCENIKRDKKTKVAKQMQKVSKTSQNDKTSFYLAGEKQKLPKSAKN